MSKKTFVHSVWVAIAMACMSCLLSNRFQPAWAGDERVVVSMPVYGQVINSELTTQAESLLSDTINRQFSQNSDLSTIQVDVVGDRHGEIIPLLTVTVSRDQWQSNPQVGAWSRYYRASYALLQRYESEQTVAIAPAQPASSSTDASIRDRFLIDEAFDSGRLVGSAAQDYLSDLD